MSILYTQGLQYDQLTHNQQEFFKKYIWNGVGYDHYPINPHDLIFKEASVYHDYYFFRGGSNELRLLADKDFLVRGLKAVQEQKRLLKPVYWIIAYVYYFALILLSKKAWEYYDEPSADWKEFIDRVKKSYDVLGKNYRWHGLE